MISTCVRGIKETTLTCLSLVALTSACSSKDSLLDDGPAIAAQTRVPFRSSVAIILAREEFVQAYEGVNLVSVLDDLRQMVYRYDPQLDETEHLAQARAGKIFFLGSGTFLAVDSPLVLTADHVVAEIKRTAGPYAIDKIQAEYEYVCLLITKSVAVETIASCYERDMLRDTIVSAPHGATRFSSESDPSLVVPLEYEDVALMPWKTTLSELGVTQKFALHLAENLDEVTALDASGKITTRVTYWANGSTLNNEPAFLGSHGNNAVAGSEVVFMDKDVFSLRGYYEWAFYDEPSTSEKILQEGDSGGALLSRASDFRQAQLVGVNAFIGELRLDCLGSDEVFDEAHAFINLCVASSNNGLGGVPNFVRWGYEQVISRYARGYKAFIDATLAAGVSSYVGVYGVTRLDLAAPARSALDVNDPRYAPNATQNAGVWLCCRAHELDAQLELCDPGTYCK